MRSAPSKFKALLLPNFAADDAARCLGGFSSTSGRQTRQLSKTGHFTSVRRLFAFFEVNERYGDITSTIQTKGIILSAGPDELCDY